MPQDESFGFELPPHLGLLAWYGRRIKQCHQSVLSDDAHQRLEPAQVPVSVMVRSA